MSFEWVLIGIATFAVCMLPAFINCGGKNKHRPLTADRCRF